MLNILVIYMKMLVIFSLWIFLVLVIKVLYSILVQ